MAAKAVRYLSTLRDQDIDAELLDTVDAAFPCRYLRYLPLVGPHLAPWQVAG